jgi:hypothetical protein
MPSSFAAFMTTRRVGGKRRSRRKHCGSIAAVEQVIGDWRQRRGRRRSRSRVWRRRGGGSRRNGLFPGCGIVPLCLKAPFVIVTSWLRRAGHGRGPRHVLRVPPHETASTRSARSGGFRGRLRGGGPNSFCPAPCRVCSVWEVDVPRCRRTGRGGHGWR